MKIKEQPTFGTVLNVDPDELLRLSRAIDWNYDDIENKCLRWFRQYLNCGISDLIWDLDDTVPTSVRDWYTVRYPRTEENGEPVSYAENQIAKAIWNVYTKTDCNPYTIWLGEARKHGIRPWISFRMNDVHYANCPTGHRSFFYRARENGWMVGDYHSPDCWYGYALDYSVPEVREEQLSYIRDLTEHYDAYGIELDFSRTIRCFRELGRQNEVYMTEFFVRVHEILKCAEERWGHPWRLMLRLSTKVERAHQYGFDVERLVTDGLVDVLVPTGYWGSTDSGIPIQEWKKACGACHLPILWGVEECTVNWRHKITPEVLAGYTRIAYASGADGVYLFNAFYMPHLWKISSSPQAALDVPVRRFLVTMNDIQVIGYTEPETMYLPLFCEANQPVSFTLPTGELGAGEQLLCVGVQSGADTASPEEAAEGMTIRCGGMQCVLTDRTNCSYMEIYDAGKTMNGYPWRIFTYRIPAEVAALGEEQMVLEFSAKDQTAICYIELIDSDTEKGISKGISE